ncbi:SDR family NAD(P)-dependent oxidoreductase [Lichenicoccus sp.]|uniref:SDR family NAD(P)-dependent oxidoreductase n=1 Tax=Lichenicoccus sp. TaxID=2781899 RepID=UPI003D14DDAD
MTGANRGIGFEVARVLASRGCAVWLGARDTARGAAAAGRLSAQGLDVTALDLDVADENSVRRAAARVTAAGCRLDILVNNAGVALGSGTSPSVLDMEQIRAMFEINLFGCIRTTQAFLPLLRHSAAGRVVMVSSDMGSQGHQTDPGFPYYDLNPMGYAASKAAMNAVAIAFAKELRGSPIKVNVANPGFTATDLNEHRGVRTVEQGAEPIVALAMLPDDGPTGSFLGPDGPEPW